MDRVLALSLGLNGLDLGFVNRSSAWLFVLRDENRIVGLVWGLGHFEIEIEMEEEEFDWGAVREFIAREVDDWDDDVAARARFKDFSGQRSDWNPRFVFWRDLILKICRRFEILFLRPRLLSNHWFIRRGVAPLCLPHVLLLMSEEGHLVRSERLLDPRTPRLSRIFTKLRNLWVTFTASDDDDDDDIKEDDIDVFVVMPVLKEKAGQVVKLLSEEETQLLNSSVIVTMSRFEQLCGGSSASAILSYLSSQSQARFVCHMNIQGVKVSLSASPVSSISSLDCDILHLISTQETLHQQLSLIDKRCQRSKESALASLASGNKNVALRHTRTLKLANLSRDKCTTLLNRVHQVLHVIANAESTNKVSEALQIGAQAIKENSISVKQVEHTLQQLDESIDLQNQVQNALESTPSNTFVDDEDIEEEFKKLELEIGSAKKSEAEAHATAGETEALDSAESLNEAFSNLKLADGLSSTAAGRHIAAKETKNLEFEAA